MALVVFLDKFPFFAMPMYEIITGADNPLLRKESVPIKTVNSEIHRLFRDMRKIMHIHRGVGLAAPQIGIHKRVIIIEYVPSSKETSKPIPFLALANPDIYWKSKETSVEEEGCLSLPDYRVNVRRPKEIKLTGLDEKGKQLTIHAKDMKARILQHEIDHLNGVLIIDYEEFPLKYTQ